MNQQDDLLSLFSHNWAYFKDNYLNTPPVGLALVLLVFLTAVYYSFKESSSTEPPRNRFEEALSSFSSKERLIQSFRDKKSKDDQYNQPFSSGIASSSLPKSKIKEDIKQRVREKYLKSSKRSLIYETLDEQKAEEDRKVKQAEKAKRELEQQRLKEKMAKEQKQKELKEKQMKAREKKKVQFQEDQPKHTENQNKIETEKTVRSGERKTTIQLVVDQNQKKNQQEKSKTSQTFTLFGNTTSNQIPSLLNPAGTAPAINQATQNSVPSTGSIGTTNQLISNQLNSLKLAGDLNQPTAPKIQPVAPSSLFSNIPKPPAPTQPKQEAINPLMQGSKANTSPVAPLSQPIRPPPGPTAPMRQQLKLSSEQYLQEIMKYADAQTATVQISTIMANLGGAKSSLNDLLTFAQSFIDTITKTDDNQLTAFSVKIYQGIIRQISTSNLKDGIYRIPPKSKTDQVEKNSINCYILYINLYRLMGFEKVWVIVFGKLLRLLDFIYKRKTDLKGFTELELLVSKQVEKRGELEGKYLSRLDYLTYMLFGLTAFDPLMVFRQIQEKEPNVRESREKVESFGRDWSYKEFWILTDLFLKNKHDSYFKPIVYMNILSVLYPRIYVNKQNPDHFKGENEIYRLILEQGKKYFGKFKMIPQLKALRETVQGNGFQYDGDNFIQDIKVLQSRLTAEKVKEFNLKLGDNRANAREFQSKSNVFYYFCKEK